METVDAGPFGKLAKVLGTNEPALKLLISILMSYPLAIIHRKMLYGRSAQNQHIYFFLCGILICFFNYGKGTLHSLICVFTAYLLPFILGQTAAMVGVAFTFQMGYLLIGYYYTETENYDITWTMCHCVLTLRLIGLAFDEYDGSKKPEKLSEEQKTASLQRLPSLIEVLGYSYFFGTLMVGPQLSLQRYLSFTRGTLIPESSTKKPDCIKPALLRFLGGVVYVAVLQLLLPYFPEDYPISESFKDLSFFKKLVMISIWGQVSLAKYISCWLLVEGGCILTGIAYNGKDKENKTRWDACCNIKVIPMALVTSFHGVVSSFNLCTNKWVAQYIYKRLKFVGVQIVSHLSALLFLAVWHGFHPGYYIAFLLEFIVIKNEKDIKTIVEKNKKLNGIFSDPIISLLTQVLMKLYMFVMISYCLFGIVMRSLSKTIEASSNLWFSGHIIYGALLLLMPYIRSTFVPKKKSEEHNGKSS